ncbi:MAG: ATP-dependent nuclease [Candidatus Brocadiia bacterium]
MKILSVLLRWYKSFNLNYRQYTERVTGQQDRPWNELKPEGVNSSLYPFIEIPLEEDINTIVGGNESGKSHLINAVMKVLTGKGTGEDDAYSRTDLCHYASLRTKNAELWPNIGLQFEASPEEIGTIFQSIEQPTPATFDEAAGTLTLILAPDGSGRKAVLYVNREQKPTALDDEQLALVRDHLPGVRFIDSQVAIADQLSLSSLMAAYSEDGFEPGETYEQDAAQQAARWISEFCWKNENAKSLDDQQAECLLQLRETLEAKKISDNEAEGLERLLFEDVLGIKLETLRHLAGLRERDRGYIEGLIATWNNEIDSALNLAQYWQQDQDFTLRIDYKQGILYFEITDKTGSVYTFHERSSGLRYFLSYYIQAKAIAASPCKQGNIILMDEPDSYLSILGQRNLLAIFESLVSYGEEGPETQLIYTTHSPFLINRNFPQRLCLVRKGDAEEGTQYVDRSRIRRYEPVRSALGVECAHTLFMGATNVLLEGPTDQYLLAELIRFFITKKTAGEFLDLNDVVFAPADSASAIEKLIAASQWGDEPIPTAVVLVDDDEAGHDARKRITGEADNSKKLVEREFVLLISEVLDQEIDGQKVVTSEDIVPPRLYAEAVRRYLRQWHPDAMEGRANEIKKVLADDNFGADGLVEDTTGFFRDFVFGSEERGYDKLGVLQELIKMLPELSPPEDWKEPLEDLQERVLKVCHCLKRKIARSRRIERQRSGTDAVRRIIRDFMGPRQKQASVFELEVYLLERLQREADHIGEDAFELSKTLSRLIDRTRKLRAAKQDLLSGDAWKKWREQISSISKTPLNPKIIRFDEDEEESGQQQESTEEETNGGEEDL